MTTTNPKKPQNTDLHFPCSVLHPSNNVKFSKSFVNSQKNFSLYSDL